MIILPDQDIEDEVAKLRRDSAYAAGYAAGLEQAANVCEDPDVDPLPGVGAIFSAAIRALAQQPPPTGGHGAESQ